MKQFRFLPVLLLILTAPAALFAQSAKDYLGIPGPIVFNGKTYNLARSTYTPDSTSYNTYTQEYLAAGDTLAIYKSLILVTVYTPNADMDTIANAKLAELGLLKASNPVVNYQTFNNKKTGEYMIDFLTSENTPDGQYIDMAERNVYRYKMVNDSTGKECLLLFGASTRAYGDDVENFMNALKSKGRLDLIRQVGLFKLPEVNFMK